MIEKLKELLALHTHLRDWPTLKNAKAAVEAQIKEIEEKLAAPAIQGKAKAIPAETPSYEVLPPAEDGVNEVEIERRV